MPLERPMSASSPILKDCHIQKWSLKSSQWEHFVLILFLCLNSTSNFDKQFSPNNYNKSFRSNPFYRSRTGHVWLINNLAALVRALKFCNLLAFHSADRATLGNPGLWAIVHMNCINHIKRNEFLSAFSTFFWLNTHSVYWIGLANREPNRSFIS